MTQKYNPEIVEDYLENDQPIPGQNFVCLSFVSPESVIEQKELYYMNEFFKKTCEEMGINKNDALNFLKKYDFLTHFDFIWICPVNEICSKIVNFI